VPAKKKSVTVVSPKPTPKVKRVAVALLVTKTLAKFGLFKIEGSETVPPGAKRIDIADVYPVYVVTVGPWQFALDIGRDK
jgi:hypothetical protein